MGIKHGALWNENRRRQHRSPSDRKAAVHTTKSSDSLIGRGRIAVLHLIPKASVEHQERNPTLKHENSYLCSKKHNEILNLSFALKSRVARN